MATTNILTAQPDDLAADYYVLTDPIIDLLKTPAIRSNAIAKAKPKAVGAASYLWTVGAGLKGTSKEHINKLHSNGIGWRAIYEAGSADSDLGAAKGTLAAKKAIEYLLKVAPDYPNGLTITFCSDTDTTSPDLQANKDFHAAAAQVLKEDGRWKASAYGDYDIAEVLPAEIPVTIPGASYWSRRWFSAIAGVNRGDSKAMTQAMQANKLRIIDTLQQSNGAGKLVDWLFMYTSRVQFWLPGAGDPVGPPAVPAALKLLPLKRGSVGNDVAFAQTIYKHVCSRPTMVVDGIFGNQTEQATRDFQTFFGLHVDGVIGTAETWPMLIYVNRG